MGTAAVTTARAGGRATLAAIMPLVLTAAAYAILFAKPALMLADDWWNNPEAGHGLLLFPVSLWLVWRSGLRAGWQANRALGLAIIAAAALLRVAAELGAELYTMRMSMLGAAFGLVVFHFGLRQLLAWWLPALLLILSVPLPELVVSSIALPLQFKASQMGAALLEWRHVPVRLTGNIILLPGHQLFVTEACSGLRSLTALVAIGVLMGGLWLKHPITRVLLVAAAIPIAIFINGIRVFLTGFLVYFVDPALGDGFMHLTEGWLLFLVSFALVGAAAWMFHVVERAILSRRETQHA